MARWRITVSGEGLRMESIEKLVKNLAELKEDVNVSVVDATPPESRADRFDEAIILVGDAKGEMESLRDELQEWYDNLPENFQQGSKGEELEIAIQELEGVIDALDTAEGTSVSFPSMY